MNHALTRREMEVLRMVALNWPNKKIAKELGISLYTVKNHVHAAIEKLSTTDRFQAARLAFNLEPTKDTHCDNCPLASKVSVVAAELQKLADELKG